MPSERVRSRSPIPTNAKEARQLHDQRLAEYQAKREARKKAKAAEEAAEKEAREKKKAAEAEERRKLQDKFKPRARSRSPLPKERGRSPKRSDEEKAKERAEKIAAEEAKIAALREKRKKKEEAADKIAWLKEEAGKKAKEDAEKNETVAEKAVKNKSKEQAAAKQANQKAEESKKNLENERMKKWKEQQAKLKAAAGKTPAVERVPKLSALLAMGGPEAEEYKKRQAAAKLGNWKSNAGDRWEITCNTWDGRSISTCHKDEVVKGITLDQAVEVFQHNPEKFLAMHYFPDRPDQFTFVLRAETVGYKPLGVRDDDEGRLILWQHIYKRLDPVANDVLPKAAHDKYTDAMTFEGKKLHSDTNKPLLPGRGMGIGDEANMAMIDFPQPAHVRQGACVGDCWMLSAIACLADFDWAVDRLFRKTPIQILPKDKPNSYTVTLWDLKTWKEVDVVVDERLPVQSNGSGELLGARPSKDGKFWVPYLEKAMAVHCGGYDKICGGNCTDAWPMLTGSRNQYQIFKNPKTKKYNCGAKYNIQEAKWSELTNSPHDCNPAIWPVDWPTVGGGGDYKTEITEDELFNKIVIWDQNNFLIGAATAGTSDKQQTNGIVDNHAYSVIDSRQNICGSGIDLLLIRNPWGEGGELEDGQFMRSGPGWNKYPDIKKELNPSTEDNGLCWVTKSEFFQYFPTVYVSAFNMTRLKDKNYVNDLATDIRSKWVSKKKVTKPDMSFEEGIPINIDKSSIPNSKYKVVAQTYDGGIAFCDMNKKVFTGKSIKEAVYEFKTNPEKYMAIYYQNNVVDEGWPIDMHQFTYVYRDGSDGLEVEENPKGKRTILFNELK